MIRAGGEAYVLFCAWRYGGGDPYALYNGLDSDFRPLEGGERRPPPHPWRYRMFLYGCATFAQHEEYEKVAATAGGSVTRQMG